MRWAARAVHVRCIDQRLNGKGGSEDRGVHAAEVVVVARVIRVHFDTHSLCPCTLVALCESIEYVPRL